MFIENRPSLWQKKSGQIQPVIADIAVIASVYKILKSRGRNHMITNPQKFFQTQLKILLGKAKLLWFMLYNLSATKKFEILGHWKHEILSA